MLSTADANYPFIPDEDMPRWESWIESTTGIALRGRKRVLEQGIYPRLQACGVTSLQDYQLLVDSSLEGRAEKFALIDQLTVKDSSFFRQQEAMLAVGEYLRRRARENLASERELKIWSVGCARGQEAYSLGMIAAEQFAYTDTRWRVLGTDISPTAVIAAARGVYSDKQVSVLSGHRRTRFFARQEDAWQVQEHLRERVRFGTSNLKDVESCPYRELDVIYCQNVLIYFRADMVNRILDQLAQRLRPGGILVLGAGEASEWNAGELSRWRPEILNAYRLG